ncbi:hypothetical protein [Halorubrum persicum]|uniref:hypothetical protein n=1 Tax=Halorubrum persicum TaxID=1383844 RepID=UPI0015D47908|nr:hypothetical protein [Halorubrum persicum]
MRAREPTVATGVVRPSGSAPPVDRSDYGGSPAPDGMAIDSDDPRIVRGIDR